MFFFKVGKHEKRKRVSNEAKNIKHEKEKKTAHDKDKIEFTTEDKSKAIVAEAYKTLRTNIQYSSLCKEIKTIVITSAEMSEGKSTVAKNIALSFSQSEKKVILIDCDLRKPSVHVSFKTSNSVGISEILIGNATVEESVQLYKDRFYFLTSGKTPSNPSEILDSAEMTNLIERLKDEYDIIILDTAPLNIVTDAQILATKVDGTILVVKATITKKQAVIEAKNLLNKVGANIIGTVLYSVESTKGNKYYY
jgi:capsular exopolysaccharide synthesis family protein